MLLFIFGWYKILLLYNDITILYNASAMGILLLCNTSWINKKINNPLMYLKIWIEKMIVFMMKESGPRLGGKVVKLDDHRFTMHKNSKTVWGLFYSEYKCSWLTGIHLISPAVIYALYLSSKIDYSFILHEKWILFVPTRDHYKNHEEL